MSLNGLKFPGTFDDQIWNPLEIMFIEKMFLNGHFLLPVRLDRLDSIAVPLFVNRGTAMLSRIGLELVFPQNFQVLSEMWWLLLLFALLCVLLIAKRYKCVPWGIQLSE